jgi:hypothetical protein
MEKYCTAGQPTDDNIPRRMRVAWRVPKAIHTHSKYVILISLPLQQWLHERALVVRYTYITCLILYAVWYTTTELVFIVSLSGHVVLWRVERYSYLHSVSRM